MIGPALDDHVSGPQSSFATFEDERCFSLQETDDVDRMGFMHSWVQRLIHDVTRAVKFGKPFAHGRIGLRLGYAIRLGMDYEPAHLKIALSRSEHRARGPEIFLSARRRRLCAEHGSAAASGCSLERSGISGTPPRRTRR
jgi:hypothetical protein